MRLSERPTVHHTAEIRACELGRYTEIGERCQGLLEAFDRGRDRFFSAEDRDRGGYLGEDRCRQVVLHPLLSLSVGAVRSSPGLFQSHHELSSAAAVAKKEAKRGVGSVLFVERRSSMPAGASLQGCL